MLTLRLRRRVVEVVFARNGVEPARLVAAPHSAGRSRSLLARAGSRSAPRRSVAAAIALSFVSGDGINNLTMPFFAASWRASRSG